MTTKQSAKQPEEIIKTLLEKGSIDFNIDLFVEKRSIHDWDKDIRKLNNWELVSEANIRLSCTSVFSLKHIRNIEFSVKESSLILNHRISDIADFVEFQLLGEGGIFYLYVTFSNLETFISYLNLTDTTSAKKE